MGLWKKNRRREASEYAIARAIEVGSPIRGHYRAYMNGEEKKAWETYYKCENESQVYILLGLIVVICALLFGPTPS